MIRTTALVVLYTIALLTYRLSGHPGLFAAAIALLMLAAAWVSPFALPAGAIGLSVHRKAHDSKPDTAAGATVTERAVATSHAEPQASSLSALEIELEQLERDYWQDCGRFATFDDQPDDGERRA